MCGDLYNAGSPSVDVQRQGFGCVSWLLVLLVRGAVGVSVQPTNLKLDAI